MVVYLVTLHPWAMLHRQLPIAAAQADASREILGTAATPAAPPQLNRYSICREVDRSPSPGIRVKQRFH